MKVERELEFANIGRQGGKNSSEGAIKRWTQIREMRWRNCVGLMS